MIIQTFALLLLSFTAQAQEVTITERIWSNTAHSGNLQEVVGKISPFINEESFTELTYGVVKRIVTEPEIHTVPVKFVSLRTVFADNSEMNIKFEENAWNTSKQFMEPLWIYVNQIGAAKTSVSKTTGKYEERWNKNYVISHEEFLSIVSASYLASLKTFGSFHLNKDKALYFHPSH
ncbi:MAG TPA: hypothetical protein VNJ08_01275 [Bacteriovoracaceae bacterium]|nr:hypothetical protein [Bacteriovoracaceae bacterium]